MRFLNAAAHSLGELVHAHHAGGNCRLDFLDHLVATEIRRLADQTAGAIYDIEPTKTETETFWQK